MTGGSVSIGAPVSDTLTPTVGSGIVVVVDWEIIGGGKEVVEIGMEETGGGGGKEVVVCDVVGGEIGTTETGTACFGDRGGVGSL